MSKLKYTVKDSVFTTLFGNIENALALYQSLHPEDETVSVEDCEIITLETVIAPGIYNDLGLQVRDTLILLAEAQSTFSPNVALRVFLYLANTYKEYVMGRKLSLYSPKEIRLPRPELFVIYTGDQPDVPKTLRLSDLFREAPTRGSGIEVTVEVIQKSGGLLGEYISFCKISDEQRRLHGRTDTAAQETIRVCLERGILVPLLSERRKEIVDMMKFLFTQEEVNEMERQSAKREGLNEGMAKGVAKRDSFYGTLIQLLSPLGRINELAAATSDQAKLLALAEEFGLEL